MTTFVETSSAWVVTVTALDPATQVLGGVGGPSNVPLQQLVNRTAYLKAQVEGKAALGHGHAVADVAGLQAALDGKGSIVHVHAIGDVTGLQSALDAKAPYIHTHVIGDVTGLQAALDGKAPISHVHGIASVTGLQAALDGKAAASHTHTTNEINGLQVALDAKAALGHTHQIADVAGLQPALDGKAAVGHTHVFPKTYDFLGAQPIGATGTQSIEFVWPVIRACVVDLGYVRMTGDILTLRKKTVAGDIVVLAYGNTSGITPQGSSANLTLAPGEQFMAKVETIYPVTNYCLSASIKADLV